MPQPTAEDRMQASLRKFLILAAIIVAALLGGAACLLWMAFR
jgi:hypothetical protein